VEHFARFAGPILPIYKDLRGRRGGGGSRINRGDKSRFPEISLVVCIRWRGLEMTGINTDTEKNISVK